MGAVAVEEGLVLLVERGAGAQQEQREEDGPAHYSFSLRAELLSAMKALIASDISRIFSHCSL